MSRTYKHLSTRQHRKPSGKKQAIINEARKGSVPPSEWDDLAHDDHCHLPYKVAATMYKKGNLSDDKIIQKLCKKFKLVYSDALEVLEIAKVRY